MSLAPSGADLIANNERDSPDFGVSQVRSLKYFNLSSPGGLEDSDNAHHNSQLLKKLQPAIAQHMETGMNKRKAGEAAPYGQACLQCFKSKCKCVVRSEGDKCER